MDKRSLVDTIRQKHSYLCVGLDTDVSKIPGFLLNETDPVFAFNKAVIDATAPYAVAYKFNTAFYESRGVEGWQSMQKTLEYIPEGIFTIADAKRGDIGNTSMMYAQAFFDPSISGLGFDSITVAPYMGQDSVSPFLSFPGKWVILLALTSNSGSSDFQFLPTPEEPLFKRVLRKSTEWAGDDQMMYVVGATQAEKLKEIRHIVPNHFLLVPGVGAQGGSLAEVSRYGFNPDVGLLINASRSIIYASQGEDFAEAAGKEARRLQSEMAALMRDLLDIT